MLIDYQINGETTTLFIQRKDKQVIEVLIDTDDLELVGEYDWHAVYNKCIKGFYIMTCTTLADGTIYKDYLHRVIMQPSEGFVIDHINHITTDNRRFNLRICTQKDNMQNLKEKFRYRKLNKEAVLDILTNKDLTDRVMAKKYNVSQVLITKIRNGDNKSYIFPEIPRRKKYGLSA